jgi:CTP synthase
MKNFGKKFIFITGGVLSSLGKGLTGASIGALLECMGYRVSFLKLDPYLNVDPGTMSPHQHGEVFVTTDGAETDLDLGHYERFTHATLRAENSITAGKLYAQLIEKERKGDFLGSTIQIVPHLTDAIKQAIYNASSSSDFTLVEIGGTVGDIEGLPFIEAIRQMGLYENRSNCLYIHLTYVPYLKMAQELKTKPTQHAVKALSSLGIQPDILICRSEIALSQETKDKISLFTNVQASAIISAPDLETIYELPLYLAEQQLPQVIARCMRLDYKAPALEKWQTIVTTLKTLDKHITVAIVGKYTATQDAYKSLYEALLHAQIATRVKIKIVWVDSEQLTQENHASQLKDSSAIIVPGGFGGRGVEGKIIAVRYARENNIPFLGICLGMQIAVIEFARTMLNLPLAHSTEFMETSQPVIDVMADQKWVTHKGGSMRLGAQTCAIKPATLAHAIYQQSHISERHRHRYEFNSRYADRFAQAGFIISGSDATNNLPEIIEIPGHKHFIACQFHPELQSKPFAPHPLFVSLIQATL